jgi:3-oxoacyl-[acyl-carrier protein] reductase
MKLTNKKLKVLITGGSRGTGRGIAHVLHKAGYEVIAIGKNKQAEFLNPEIRYIQANLSIPIGVSKITQLIEHECPPILINCLGIEKNSIFTEMTKENYNLVMNTNVTCHVELAKAAIPHMVKNNWGRIIFITSVWGNIGTCRRAVYTMSKFALHGLAMSLADEYAKDGIRINCVAPGFVNIDETSTPGRGEKRNEFLANKVPVQRLCQPEEIGKTVEWLISKDSDYISGQVIVVDGGFQNSGSRGEVF